jgi:Tfp pilus assembly protein PilN
LAVGDIGFPDDQLPLLDPFLPVPVGLALGGLLTGKRIDLLGARVREPIDRSQLIKYGALAAAALLVVLGGLYFLKKGQVDDARDDLHAAEAKNRALQSEISALSDVAERQTQIETLAQQTQALLTTDVAWSSVLQGLSRTIPSDVWLTSFQGTVGGDATGATAAPTTGSTGSTIGTATFAAVGTSFDAVAAWIRRIGSDVPDFSDLWVPSAAKSGSAGTTSTDENVTFSSTANLTDKAKSDRAEAFKVTP